MSYPYKPINQEDICTPIVNSYDYPNISDNYNFCGTNPQSSTLSSNVIYNGPDLSCVNILTNDTLSVALQKINTLICEPLTNAEIVIALGYTPENLANKVSVLSSSNVLYPNNNAVIDALALKEDEANKQDSLLVDGTGAKYPTVDAVNAEVVKLTGDQTIAGLKTFSSDIKVNGLTVGRGSGDINSNTVLGLLALTGNTTGDANTAIGIESMRANQNGSRNSAVGFSTLKANVSASDNSAFGFNALRFVVTGSNNEAFGSYALFRSTGTLNSAMGSFSFFNMTSGTKNIGIGYQAGSQITGGAALNNAVASIFIGVNTKALADNQTNQIAIGNDSIGLGSNTTVLGNSSTAFSRVWGRNLIGTSVDNGVDALQVLGSASIGNDVTVTNKNKTIELLKAQGTTGSLLNYQYQYWNGSAYTATNNYGLGFEALKNNTGSYSNGFGHQVLRSNTGGNSNGFGHQALINNTGTNSNGFGHQVLYNNTGGNSSGFGHLALYNNTGVNSNGFGVQALQNNTGNYANGFGSYALQFNTGAQSNGFGAFSLTSNTGSYSNGFGYESLKNNTGNYSNGVGSASLYFNVGTHSVGFGANTLYNNNYSQVSSLGSSNFSYFNPNVATAKTFTDANINVTNKTVTITAHGFGTVGTKVNLKFTGTGSPLPSGLNNNQVYQVTITDANTLTMVTLSTTGTTVSGTFTKDYDITGATQIGYNVYASGINEVIIGTGAISKGANTVVLGGESIVNTHLKGRVNIGGSDNGVDKLQVSGTISATAATTANQVVIKSQLDSKVDGSGTINRLAKFTASGAIGDSQIIDDGTRVLVGGAIDNLRDKVQISGGLAASSFVLAPNFNLSVVPNGNTMNGISGTIGVSFVTQAVTRMVLSNSGNFSIGTTTDNGIDKLQVNGSASFTSDIKVNGLTVGKGGGNILSNVSFGISSLGSNTTGSSNTAVGYLSLALNTTGLQNTAFGNTALYANTTGVYNTAIGFNSGRYIADGITTNINGGTSVFLGYNTKALANSQTNQVVIGHNAIGLGSNTAVLGNTSTAFSRVFGRNLIGTSVDNGVDALQVDGSAIIKSNTYGHSLTLGSLDGSIMQLGADAVSGGNPSIKSLTGTLILYANSADLNKSMSLKTSGIFLGAGYGSIFGEGSQNYINYSEGGSGNLKIATTVANPITFLTNNVERARFLANGNFAIGSNTADAKLDIFGGSVYGKIDKVDGVVTAISGLSTAPTSNTPGLGGLGIFLNQNSLGNYPRLLLGTMYGTSNSGNIPGNMGLGTIDFAGYSKVDDKYLLGAYIRSFASNAWGSNIASGYLDFGTNSGTSSPVSRMRISEIGNVLIGTTVDNGVDKLQVNGSASFTSNLVVNGVNVGKSNTGISSNTFFGESSLQNITTGIANTAISYESLRFTTSGSSNTGLGFQSLKANTIGINNVALGVASLQNNISGNRNVSVGVQNLISNTIGNNNTAVGFQSLQANTQGNENTAAGYISLISNTSGSKNSAFGNFSSINITSGSNNLSSGSNSLAQNTTGNSNVALGFNAGTNIASGNNTIVNNSIFIGSETRALANNQTNQIVIGDSSIGLGSNTSTLGNLNTVFSRVWGRNLIGTSIDNGVDALQVQGSGIFTRATNGTLLRLNDTSSIYNDYIFETESSGSFYGLNIKRGFDGASLLNISADQKIGIATNDPSSTLQINKNGADTHQLLIGGSNGFGFGYDANGQQRHIIGSAYGNSATKISFALGGFASANDKMTIYGSGNIVINSQSDNGLDKLQVNGSANISADAKINGLTIGKGLNNGNFSTAIGTDVLSNNTTGYANTGLGQYSLLSNTTGANNLSIGIEALRNNTAGNNNLAIGFQALYNSNTVSGNSAIGYRSLFANTTGSGNAAFGQGSLTANTTGIDNVGIGNGALQFNTTGGSNMGVGNQALLFNTTGVGNSGSGAYSLLYNTTGSYNVASGMRAGENTVLARNTITNNSIFIGYNTRALADNQTNQIVIGHASVGLGSNTTVIGNASTTVAKVFGRNLIGTSADNGNDALQVNGSVSVSSYVKLSSAIFSSDQLTRINTTNNFLNIESSNNGIILNVTAGANIHLQANAVKALTVVGSNANILIGTTTDNGVDKLQVDGTAQITGETKILDLAGAGNRNVSAAASGILVINTVYSVFADNAAAIAGGLQIGEFYRTSTGALFVRF
jgi:hypothetical protein